MAKLYGRGEAALALVVGAALACAPGCTYLRARGRDALDLVDVGFTFTKKPQFGLYANCPFMAPGGYAKVDGKFAGIGGGQIGVMDHHQDAAALLLWGHEDVGWSDTDSESTEETQAHQVGPLGLAADAEGNPTYKPQCAHYLHLGWIGVTGNLNYKEWPDFFVGWVGADPSKDDRRALDRSTREKELARFSARLSRPREGLQLVALADRESYSMDEPIALDVRLVNRTGRTRRRGDRRRDLSVYFEPFATTPRGGAAEWLFKFYVFEITSERPRYKSPRFDVPADDRAELYHHVTLPPGAFVGRRFEFPSARERKWLEPGAYFAIVSYQVSDKYPYVILDRRLSARQAEALGTDAAYTRVWTGRIYSNAVVFRIKRRKLLGIF